MQKLITITILFFTCVLSNVTHASERYQLNAGDILDISVWNEDSLQKQVIVLPDGMISFPLAGDMMAEGKTITELRDKLKENLSEFLADPFVTVSVSAVSGNTINILGKVRQPGSFAMSKVTTVMQALSLAGGLTTYAKENSIIVIRIEGEKQNVIHVRYSDIKGGQDLSSNITLKSGDVIVVP
jgi:polysaccharide export outer membrane protein